MTAKPNGSNVYKLQTCTICTTEFRLDRAPFLVLVQSDSIKHHAESVIKQKHAAPAIVMKLLKLIEHYYVNNHSAILLECLMQTIKRCLAFIEEKLPKTTLYLKAALKFVWTHKQ